MSTIFQELLAKVNAIKVDLETLAISDDDTTSGEDTAAGITTGIAGAGSTITNSGSIGGTDDASGDATEETGTKTGIGGTDAGN